MNLIKSFNINYLKQNIKKSKGLLGIFLILVPLANFLLIFLNSITIDEVVTLETETFMIFNIIGMYIVPIVITVALFGYVYKKNSVDFVNSMPLDKKTIFTTNALGGIILIIGMQLLNLIIMLIGAILFKNIVIYPKMMIDIFIQMTVSYIFVYTISNIAMSISGNVITQIIVTALIAFMVPFVIHASNTFFIEKNAKIVNNYGVLEGSINDTTEFTLPYGIIRNLMRNDFTTLINYKIVIRTLILSIIYYLIGTILFEKRKMENTEESFQNEHIHLIIKLLTLVPIAYLYEFTKDYSIAVNIIIITLTCIYWFIYDLITRKKIKFKYSILYLIVGTVLLQTVVHFTYETVSQKRKKLEVINGNEISEISVDGNFYCKDEWKLEKVFQANSLKTSNGTRRIYIKLKDRRRFKYNMSYNKFKELENIIIKEKLEQEIDNCDKIQIGGKIVTGEKRNEILEELKKYENISKIKEKTNDGYFYLIGYKNNKIYKESISIKLNNEIFKKVTKIANEDAKEKLNSNKNNAAYMTYRYNSTDSIDSSDLTYPAYQEKTIEMKEAVKYINMHYQEECTMEKPYYILKSKNIKFYTNNIEDINNLS